MAETPENIRFAGFILDRPGARLLEGDREIELAPRAFQVLTYLIDNRERVIPKQELIEAVWKDTFVTDDALVQAITAIRKAMGDGAENSRFIRTRPRVGYQFVAVVEGANRTESETRGPMPVWVAPVSRRTARRLVILIQFAYLIIYSVTLIRLEQASRSLGAILDRMGGWGEVAIPVLIVLTLIGTAVRLYVMAAVTMDHPQTGSQFQKLFPALFVLDELWAASPLLLVEDYGIYLALALVPVLAYAPFSQVTMMRSAYSDRKGPVG